MDLDGKYKFLDKNGWFLSDYMAPTREEGKATEVAGLGDLFEWQIS